MQRRRSYAGNALARSVAVDVGSSLDTHADTSRRPCVDRRGVPRVPLDRRGLPCRTRRAARRAEECGARWQLRRARRRPCTPSAHGASPASDGYPHAGRVAERTKATVLKTVTADRCTVTRPSDGSGWWVSRYLLYTWCPLSNTLVARPSSGLRLGSELHLRMALGSRRLLALANPNLVCSTGRGVACLELQLFPAVRRPVIVAPDGHAARPGVGRPSASGGPCDWRA
jgi:hypothetical protein